MHFHIKTRVQKTKKFAQENSTLVACALTAVVASKITYNITTDHCVAKYMPILRETEEKLATVDNVARYCIAFIGEQGLMDKFVATDPRLAQ